MSSNLRKAVIKMYQLKSKFYKVNTTENIEFCQKKKINAFNKEKKICFINFEQSNQPKIGCFGKP